MKITHVLFLLFTITVTANAHAGTVASSTSIKPCSVCPAVSEDASKVLSSIQKLRDEVKKLPECEPLDKKLQNVSHLLGQNKWEEVKQIFKGTKNVELEGDDIDEITGIIEGVSKSLAETVSMLSSNGASCVDKKNKTSFLSKVSGVVKEVSSVAGHVAGPYGMAVNLGGQFLSAALNGIEKLLPSNAYNFKDPEDETLFMNQFCSYAEINKDAQDYLGLSTRQEELTVLNGYLDNKIKDLENNCPECKGFAIAWRAKEQSDNIVQQMIRDVRIVRLGDDLNSNNYSHCAAIHSAIHTEGSHLSQFFNLLGNYQNPMMSQSDKDMIVELVASESAIKKYYPRYQQCTVLPNDQKVALAHSFNNLLRDDVLPMNDRIFSQQMQAMEYVANQKFLSPLGEYILNSLSRRKWISKERDRVYNQLLDANYDISTQKIRESMLDLEKQFMRVHFPRYLKFMVKRNVNGLKAFEKLIQKPVTDADKDKRIKIGSDMRIQSQLNLLFSQTRTFHRYCEYTRYILLATPTTQEECAKGRAEIQAMYLDIQTKNPELKAKIESAQLWPMSSEVYQTSRVSEYSNHINEWNMRGEKRWCLKTDQNCAYVERRP
jgi:hypothetical protein